LTVIFLDFCSPPEARKPAGGPRTQPLRKGGCAHVSRTKAAPRQERRRCRDIRLLDDCTVFKVRRERAPAGLRPPVSQNSTACRRRHIHSCDTTPDSVDV